MARSTNVYLVSLSDGAPVAAFTVKHELITYLRKLDHLDEIRVFRIPDGGSFRLGLRQVTDMNPAELLR